LSSSDTIALVDHLFRKQAGQSVATLTRALDRALSGDRVTACHLEAGIAACHAAAASWESTDWSQIVALYDDLLALTGSPVVAVNRAVAVSRLDGARSGLAALGLARSAPERRWLTSRLSVLV